MLRCYVYEAMPAIRAVDGVASQKLAMRVCWGKGTLLAWVEALRDAKEALVTGDLRALQVMMQMRE